VRYTAAPPPVVAAEEDGLEAELGAEYGDVVRTGLEAVGAKDGRGRYIGAPVAKAVDGDAGQAEGG
jgi:hypothetical protein